MRTRIIFLLVISLGALAIALVVSFLSTKSDSASVDLNCMNHEPFCADVSLTSLHWHRGSSGYRAKLTLKIESAPRIAGEIDNARFTLGGYWFDFIRAIPETHSRWASFGRESRLSNPKEVEEGGERVYRDVLTLAADDFPLKHNSVKERKLFPLDQSTFKFQFDGCVLQTREDQSFLCGDGHSEPISLRSLLLASSEDGVTVRCNVCPDEGKVVQCSVSRSNFVVMSTLILFLVPVAFYYSVSGVETSQKTLMRTLAFWGSFGGIRGFLPTEDIPFPTLLDLLALCVFVVVFCTSVIRSINGGESCD